MLSHVDYLLAWSLYLLAAAVLMLTVWRLSARFWSWLKDPLRAVSAVLLFLPGGVDAEGEFFAPAIFIVAFELATAEGGGIGPLLGVRLLLFVLGAVLAAWLLRLLWYWLVASRRPGATVRATGAVRKGAVAAAGTDALRAVDVRDRRAR